MTTKVLQSIGGNSVRGRNRTLVAADVKKCIAQMARTQFLEIYVSKNKRVRLKPGFERYLLKLRERATSIEIASQHEATQEPTEYHLSPELNHDASPQHQLTDTVENDDWDDEDEYITEKTISDVKNGQPNDSNHDEHEIDLDDEFELPEFPEGDEDIQNTFPNSATDYSVVEPSTSRLNELSSHLTKIGKPPTVTSDSLSIECGEGTELKIVRVIEAIDHHLELQIEVRELSEHDIERFLVYQCSPSCVFTLCKTFSGRYYLKRLIQTSKHTNDEIAGMIERLYRNSLDVGA